MAFSAMFSLTILFLCLVGRSIQTNEKKLHADVMATYTRFARPVKNISDPVVVTFGFELVHIVKIAESEQTITQKVWIRMAWKNEYLTWNPSDYGGISKTRVEPNAVWTPDLFLQEDVSSDMATGPERYRTQVVMSSNGQHQWWIPTLFQSSCQFEIDNFPFDKQNCRLLFTPWTHDQSEIDIKIDPRPIITGNYINSSEWDLLSVEPQVKSTKYACCPNPYVDISFTIFIQRKPLYYIFSVIVPCIIMMVIVLFTFFLPPDSGERIGVTITVLLVFAVYLEVLSNFLPRSSTSTPALSRFYIAAMAESGASLIATCLVLIIHFKGTEKGVGPMPGWAKHYFIETLAKYLCIQRNIREHTDEDLLALDEKGSYTQLNNQIANTDVDKKVPTSPPAKGAITLDTLVEEVRVITSLINDQNLQDEIEEEWQVLGKVFDRIFFFIFLIMFVVTSLIFLIPLYSG